MEIVYFLDYAYQMVTNKQEFGMPNLKEISDQSDYFFNPLFIVLKILMFLDISNIVFSAGAQQ